MHFKVKYVSLFIEHGIINERKLHVFLSDITSGMKLMIKNSDKPLKIKGSFYSR